MHQQVRVSTTKGLGAAADPDGFVDVLRILEEGGFNLRVADGSRLNEGGPFVFAVHHDEGDDSRDRAAAKLLRTKDYRVSILRDIRVCVLEDEPGALLRCVSEAERQDGPVEGVFVGTPEPGGGIPVQVVSRRAVEAAESVEAS